MIGSGHSRSSFKMDTPAAKSCCELVGSLAVHMPVSAEAGCHIDAFPEHRSHSEDPAVRR